MSSESEEVRRLKALAETKRKERAKAEAEEAKKKDANWVNYDETEDEQSSATELQDGDDYICGEAGLWYLDNQDAAERYIKLLSVSNKPPKATDRSAFQAGVTSLSLVNIVNAPCGKAVRAAAGQSHTVLVYSKGEIEVVAASKARVQLFPKESKGPVALGEKITGVAAGAMFSLAWGATGLYSWGYNVATFPYGKESCVGEITGQLGRGIEEKSQDVGQVPLEGPVFAASSGASHSLVLTEAGLWGFGLNASSQLAPLTDRIVPSPKLLIPRASLAVRQVAAGMHHSLFVTDSGDLYCFGWNEAGQCAQPARYKVVMRPTVVEKGGPFTSCAGGTFHSLALTRSGSVLSWGGNSVGELGRNESATGSSSPAIVSDLAAIGIRSVHAANQRSAAVDVTGGLWIWGLLAADGMTAHSKEPHLFGDGKRFITSVALGPGLHFVTLDSPQSVPTKDILVGSHSLSIDAASKAYQRFAKSQIDTCKLQNWLHRVLKKGPSLKVASARAHVYPKGAQVAGGCSIAVTNVVAKQSLHIDVSLITLQGNWKKANVQACPSSFDIDPGKTETLKIEWTAQPAETVTADLYGVLVLTSTFADKPGKQVAHFVVELSGAVRKKQAKVAAPTRRAGALVQLMARRTSVAESSSLRDSSPSKQPSRPSVTEKRLALFDGDVDFKTLALKLAQNFDRIQNPEAFMLTLPLFGSAEEFLKVILDHQDALANFHSQVLRALTDLATVRPWHQKDVEALQPLAKRVHEVFGTGVVVTALTVEDSESLRADWRRVAGANPMPNERLACQPDDLQRFERGGMCSTVAGKGLVTFRGALVAAQFADLDSPQCVELCQTMIEESKVQKSDKGQRFISQSVALAWLQRRVPKINAAIAQATLDIFKQMNLLLAVTESELLLVTPYAEDTFLAVALNTGALQLDSLSLPPPVDAPDSPVEMARQLTILFHGLYREIQPIHLLTVSAKDQKGRNPAVILFTHLRHLSSWVSFQVLKNPSGLFPFLLAMATAAHALKNYAAVFSITLGLSASSVSRLELVLAPSDKKQLEALQALIEPAANYTAYRSELNALSLEKPAVPYVGLTFQAITLVREASPSKVGPDNSLVNHEKMRKIFDIVGDFFTYTQAPYVLVSNLDMQMKWVRDLEKEVDDDVLYELSYQLKPVAE